MISMSGHLLHIYFIIFNPNYSVQLINQFEFGVR